MNLHDFLFTKKVPGKYLRHIAFWVCSLLPFLVMSFISTTMKSSRGEAASIWLYQLWKLPNIIIDMGFTYSVVYFFIPSYFHNRRVRPLLRKIFIVLLLAFIAKSYLWYFNDSKIYSDPKRFWLSTWFLIINFLNDGSIMRCTMFLICKMLKNFYLKTEEKFSITKENATAELQLLKAQVHPHFLFNTLNNIYSFSLRRSPLAASLVLKLLDTLRYMITRCQAPLVPLNEELKVLEDYIGLESVRYGDRISIVRNFALDTGNRGIAPLLLIPLVENSFKHGTSQMLDKPWINIETSINNDSLHFQIKNGKPETVPGNDGKNGIGLKNVRKRLSLLYPTQHQLVIRNSANEYEVMLQIPLHDYSYANR